MRGIKPVTFGFAPERDIWADELKSLGLKRHGLPYPHPCGRLPRHGGYAWPPHGG
ncbi:MAG: hypothetical protein L6U16_03335 [Porphyromonadaceae bacterium]|nr:MAG: hypothetical protein L6U16_03335 [Porphyromonadaceae bacterium]